MSLLKRDGILFLKDKRVKRMHRILKILKGSGFVKAYSSQHTR